MTTHSSRIGCRSRPDALIATLRLSRMTGSVEPNGGPMELECALGPTPGQSRSNGIEKLCAPALLLKVFCASLADLFEDRAELAPWRDEVRPYQQT